MNIKINEINSFKRELCVVVPWEDLKDNYNKTLNKYMSNYTPKGGRKGKFNSFQIQQFKSEHTASIEATFSEEAMNEYYKKALDNKEIQPINKAEITKLEFKENCDLDFIAVFEVVPIFKLPNYKKKYKINTVKYVSSDDDISRAILDIQEKSLNVQ